MCAHTSTNKTPLIFTAVPSPLDFCLIYSVEMSGLWIHCLETIENTDNWYVYDRAHCHAFSKIWKTIKNNQNGWLWQHESLLLQIKSRSHDLIWGFYRLPYAKEATLSAEPLSKYIFRTSFVYHLTHWILHNARCLCKMHSLYSLYILHQV